MFNFISNLFNKKTPAQLARTRKINSNNITSSKDLMAGVVKTYMQMNDPKVANQMLKESLKPLKQIKFKAR